MHETERRLRTMINPWSSAFTRWWCHSTARYILTGYGRGSGRVLHGARVLPLSNQVSNYRPRQWHTPLDASGPYITAQGWDTKASTIDKVPRHGRDH
jgi:hypothetical protein